MKIILASKNQDKIREIGKILESSKRTLVTCNDIDIPEVEDTGSAFVELFINKKKIIKNNLKSPRLIFFVIIIFIIF